MSSSCHSLNHLQFIAASDVDALVSIICHLLKVPLDIGEDDPFAEDLGSPTQAQDELGDGGETAPTTSVPTTPEEESPRPASLEPVVDSEDEPEARVAKPDIETDVGEEPKEQLPGEEDKKTWWIEIPATLMRWTEIPATLVRWTVFDPFAGIPLVWKPFKINIPEWRTRLGVPNFLKYPWRDGKEPPTEIAASHSEIPKPAGDARKGILQRITLKEWTTGLRWRVNFGLAIPPLRPAVEIPEKEPQEPISPAPPTGEKSPNDWDWEDADSSPLDSEPAETPTERPMEPTAWEDEEGRVEEDSKEDEPQVQRSSEVEAEVGPAHSDTALEPPIGLSSVSEDEGTEPGGYRASDSLVHY